MKYSRLWLVLFCYLKISAVQANTESSFVVRLGVVDVQSVLEYSVAMQNIRKTIDVISQNIQKSIAKSETELKKIEEQLNEKRPKLSVSIFKQEVDEFGQKVNRARKDLQVKKNYLDQAHGKAVHTVQEMTKIIINELAKKYQLNIVLPSSQVLFTDNSLDITPEVIKQLNIRLTMVKVNYPL